MNNKKVFDKTSVEMILQFSTNMEFTYEKALFSYIISKQKSQKQKCLHKKITKYASGHEWRGVKVDIKE